MKYQPQLAKIPGKSQRDLLPGTWIIERKWDGMRAIFEISETETLIFSRTGQDLRPQFPELLNLHERVGASCILDGEIIALDPEAQNGPTENLERLQLRLGDKLARRRDEVPVEVRFFDILELLGQDARSLPLIDRRKLMVQLPGFSAGTFQMPEIVETLADTPAHWEGTIAKRADSPYSSGKRNADWLKFKFTQRATLRLHSLTPGKGARASSFGAVVVEDENGAIRGQVGSGFSDPAIEQILELVADGKQPLIEVEYRFLSKTGLLVNTAFKGIRTDKTEADAL